MTAKRRTSTYLWMVTAVWAAAQLAAAGAGPRGGDFGSLNPSAPPETVQFAFLIGDWDCATKFMKPDGSGYVEGRAKWIGYFILDGWAIQDDWIGYGPEGQEFHGTNVRSFNPETKKWDNRWLAAGDPRWKSFVAEKRGEAMVMTGGEGRDPRGEFIDRNTFYDIGADRWRWRKDRSYDGGKSWIEGVGFIEATRTPRPSG